ncbi:MAG: glycosyltransferase [Acidobacteria bacterium]|nr:glycosyltransferase [Acidobacteriota bacterium]
MKVLYDATPLLMRSAGVKNYHYSLLLRLLPSIWPHQMELFPWLGSLPPNENQRSNYPAWQTYAGLGTMLASNWLGLPLARLQAQGADLFHVTQHLWRPPQTARLTSMVHDPTPLTMPECHTESNVRYFERFVERTLPRLDALITPSYAVKRDLVRYCGAAEERITVIPHGVDEDFFEATPAQREVARQTYELPDRYMLFVGSVEPRKNLTGLLDALEMLPDSLRRQVPLLLVGPHGWKNEEIQKRLAKTDHVRTLGYVKRELLPAVYEACSLFVFPSLYEGFGMPLLEAMAAGAPVLSSNTSAMPEVVGDAGLLVGPQEPHRMAEAIRNALEDQHTAALMGGQARQRARRFTWERCALETKKFFEETLEEAL